MKTEPQIALVTGAGSGIGRAVCHSLLGAGYSLVLLGRRLEPLQETVALSAVDADRTLCVATDVGKPEPVKQAFAKAEARFGRLDLLFNNAATPMTRAMPKGVPQANGGRVPEPVMDVEHVAQAVLQMASLPLDTNVQFMTIMATRMPFIGRG